ncbi:nucleotidyltransferase family protein [Thalassospira alkalitolerans]|uniref:Mannose-1-phosphate guanylyltransferase n=1 Tax=Thalassospira alkalitolerans TaxID=1293890 RepID=A0A1Y2LGU6_9PROT|nr:nucleotidyltransferase family protein [Thalassospira alkalitolerans]OSQ50078.1 mannose-1-phosphate guanylyltransferase [Thalassospira alkalitolerans]
MRALLLSAGLGTRLRPITETTPKCLVMINGRPLIDYWLNLLMGSGIVDRILVNTHYLPEKVRSHIAESKWFDSIDLVHEENLLGTGGTLLENSGFIGDENFLVAHADNLTWFDVGEFRDFHVNRPNPLGTIATMMTFDTDNPCECGIVERDRAGLVVGFHEKVAVPPGRCANGAVYIFEPEILNILKGLEKKIIDLSNEVLPHLMKRIYTYHNSCYLRDIGNIESLRIANEDILRIPELCILNDL